ncbi:MAG: AbrB/MazE/SpoVT family DNA-binding domain-containing protein [Clostridia bacterium]|nr:AbrB/MazE/SpoVT family DNA-binding domain-containing protein [Clostridia bacterium]
MQDSGLVRRVDDLGRLVIPKELRKTLRIKSGDAIQISKDGDNLLLRKYSPTQGIMATVQSVADSIFESTGKTCMITDTDRVICSSNKNSGEEKCLLNAYAMKVMNDRKPVFISKNQGEIPFIYTGENIEQINSRIIFPYVKDGDCFGLIVLSGENVSNTEQEKSILTFGASLLSKCI